MGEKLVVGPISQGLRTDRLPFNIDNDAFPTLINAQTWRGRVKRKRGTSFLNRLTRFFNSNSTAYSSTATITLSAGAANILTGFSLQSTGNIVPGSVTIVDTTTSTTYTDPSKNGTLSGGSGGTINYATGAITITGGGSDTIRVQFLYYPGLPALGIEDLVLSANLFPGTLAFDTTYSYNIVTSFPYNVYDVSFYKNPAASPPYNYPGYTPKTTVTPTSWNGQNYQQFWSVNYQGAFWVTNGITAPFTTSNIGMQFKPIVTVDIITTGPPSIARLHITAHGLVKGDFVFVNEVATTTGINFQTGYVVSNDPQNANFVDVEFPNATIATNGSGGIAQYLTNRSDVTKDCIRWYDGDPTNGNATNPTLNGGLGWVNFMPPLSNASFGISDLPAAQYYLVGAVMIVNFKDRLLFLGPVVQTSTGTPIYLQDTVIYSQNGTPYYTASFTGSTTSATTIYNPILTPVNQTATANSYFGDVTGFGGFISAGFAQPITGMSPNEDVLLIGFSNKETRFVYTGNDIVPFNFFVTNSEFGDRSTFSSITLDRGKLSIGDRGIILSSQIGAERYDPEIPDQVFEFNLSNNGAQRITAQRDFINEWIYFSYVTNNSSNSGNIFPNQTLYFDYREHSWGIFNETYTTYGQFRVITGLTWATVGSVFPTWSEWNQPWNSGSSTQLQPKVIAGNQQGFICFRDQGTGEQQSLSIQNISGIQVTSPNHGLNNGDYIIINGCIGMTGINGSIYSVQNVTQNTFNILGPSFSGSYIGGGTITRMYVPYIQTKQFPVAWGMGRKTRIGAQQYLLTGTANAQITLLIFLSQDSATAYNNLEFPFEAQIVPEASENNTLIYNTVLYTCPESTNLGLTPSNVNLQMPTASGQNQIWHRMNTSLIGDTVQLGFTMNDTQMRAVDDNGNPISQFAEIELHGFILDVQPSQLLA